MKHFELINKFKCNLRIKVTVWTALVSPTQLVDVNMQRIFLYLDIGVESILSPHETAAIPGPLYLPRLIVRMEKLVE
jgi:hypothetical protein